MGSTPSRRRFIVGLCVLSLIAAPAAAPGAQSPEQLYQQAQERLWRGNPAESIPFFRRLLEQHPDHKLRFDAVFGLGRALFRQGHYGAARRRFRDVARGHGDTVIRGEATLDLARVDLKQGHDTRARRRLDRFLERYPDHVLQERARRLLGRASAPSAGRDVGDTGVSPPLRTTGDTTTGRTIRLSPVHDTSGVDTDPASAGDTRVGTNPGGEPRGGP